MEQASDVVELVLPHEVDNPNNVYLYLEGDAWCAYERSAYYLTQMEVPVVLKKDLSSTYKCNFLGADNKQ